jgi:GT2 family glycosyltransferase
MRTLEFTGERMIPFGSDPATETQHWQRYCFFRPWYRGKRVIDASCGEGYGANYAAIWAASVTGYDISDEAISHAAHKYQSVQFRRQDVCEADYRDADLVLSFETIEHLTDPERFLRQLAASKATIVISTPNRALVSPGRGLKDTPYNPYHTVEWTPREFEALIRSHFQHRARHILSQDSRWPFGIQQGMRDDALFTIAVIGDLELPTWPRIGIAIPTHNGSENVRRCIISMLRSYPGELHFAVVANGCAPEELQRLRQTALEIPHLMTLVELRQNLGFAGGCNAGLSALAQRGGFDYLAVSNDDVLAGIDCLSELALGMQGLQDLGRKPGVIGPMSNAVDGPQVAYIGDFEEEAEMYALAMAHLQRNTLRLRPTWRVRGLFMLIHPDCAQEVGGFDTRFGLGNWEDDDHNLRCRLTGYSLWIAEGAFLYHQGNATFNRTGIDYQKASDTNKRIFAEKYQLANFEDAGEIRQVPQGVRLYEPFTGNSTAAYSVKR